MKIVKFIKDHIVGFKEGQVKEVQDSLALRLEKEGFVVEATKEELDAFNESAVPNKSTQLEDFTKEANKSNSNCEECGDNPECEDCKDKKDAVEVKYHLLSEEDIDANSEAAVDCVVGDEVEENEAGELLVGEDGKFIKKDLGNV